MRARIRKDIHKKPTTLQYLRMKMASHMKSKHRHSNQTIIGRQGIYYRI
ncbi:MAG TPA: hypothetical protein VI968_02050 [archaeon]|nr:hypothetical protein [archaeon]